MTGKTKSKDPITLEVEVDGRWIGSVECLNGCDAYGDTREEAFRNAKALALEVYASRVKSNEAVDPKEVAAVVAFELPHVPRERSGQEVRIHLRQRLFDLARMWVQEGMDASATVDGFLHSMFREFEGLRVNDEPGVKYELTPVTGTFDNGDWGKESFHLTSEDYFAESDRRKQALEASRASVPKGRMGGMRRE